MSGYKQQPGMVPALADKMAICFAEDKRNFPVLGVAYDELINRMRDAGAGKSAPKAGQVGAQGRS